MSCNSATEADRGGNTTVSSVELKFFQLRPPTMTACRLRRPARLLKYAPARNSRRRNRYAACATHWVSICGVRNLEVGR
jgi:hypothetical protein